MGSPTVALSDAAILTQVIDEALVCKTDKPHGQPSMVELFAALQKITELYTVDSYRTVKFKAILRVMHADTSMDWWQKLSQIDIFMTLSTSQTSFALENTTRPSAEQDDDALNLSVLLNSDADFANPGPIMSSTPSTIKRPGISSQTLLMTGGENLLTPLWERTPFAASQRPTVRNLPPTPGQTATPVHTSIMETSDDNEKEHLVTWIQRWRQHTVQKLTANGWIAKSNSFALQRAFFRLLSRMTRLHQQRQQQVESSKYWLQRLFDNWRSGMQRRNASLPALHMSCCIRVLAKFRHMEALVAQRNAQDHRNQAAILVRVWCRLKSIQMAEAAYRALDALGAGGQLVRWHDVHIAWLQDSLIQLCQRHVLQLLFVEWSLLRPMRRRAVHHHRRFALGTALSRLQANASFQRLLKRVGGGGMMVVDLRESAALVRHRRSQSRQHRAFRAWRASHLQARVTTIRWRKFMRTVCFIVWKSQWHQTKLADHQIDATVNRNLLKKYLGFFVNHVLGAKAQARHYGAVLQGLSALQLKQAVQRWHRRAQALVQFQTGYLMARTHRDMLHQHNFLRFLFATYQHRQAQAQEITMYLSFRRFQSKVVARIAAQAASRRQDVDTHARQWLFNRFLARLWFIRVSNMQQQSLACWWQFRRWKIFHHKNQWVNRRRMKKLQLYRAAHSRYQQTAAFESWHSFTVRRRRDTFTQDRAQTYHNSQSKRNAMSVWRAVHTFNEAINAGEFQSEEFFNRRMLLTALSRWKVRRTRLALLMQHARSTNALIAARATRQCFEGWRDAWADQVAATYRSTRQLKRGWAAIACLRTVLLKAHTKSHALGRRSTWNYSFRKWRVWLDGRVLTRFQIEDSEASHVRGRVAAAIHQWQKHCRYQRLQVAVTQQFQRQLALQCSQFLAHWRHQTKLSLLQKRRQKVLLRDGWERLTLWSSTCLEMAQALRSAQDCHNRSMLQAAIAKLGECAQQRRATRATLTAHDSYFLRQTLKWWFRKTKHRLESRHQVAARVVEMQDRRLLWCVRQWLLVLRLRKYESTTLSKRRQVVFESLREMVAIAKARESVRRSASRQLLATAFVSMAEATKKGQAKLEKLSPVRNRLLLLRVVVNFRDTASCQRIASNNAAQVVVARLRRQQRIAFAAWRSVHSLAVQYAQVASRLARISLMVVKRVAWQKWKEHVSIERLVEKFRADKATLRRATTFTAWRRLVQRRIALQQLLAQVNRSHAMSCRRAFFAAWQESFTDSIKLRQTKLRRAIATWKQLKHIRLAALERVLSLRRQFKHRPLVPVIAARWRNMLLWKAFHSMAQADPKQLASFNQIASAQWRRTACRRVLKRLHRLLSNAHCMALCQDLGHSNDLAKAMEGFDDNVNRRAQERDALVIAVQHLTRRALRGWQQRQCLAQRFAVAAAIDHHATYCKMKVLRALSQSGRGAQEHWQYWQPRIHHHVLRRAFTRLVAGIRERAQRHLFEAADLSQTFDRAVLAPAPAAHFLRWKRWLKNSQRQSAAIVRGLHAVFDLSMRRGFRRLLRHRLLARYFAACDTWATQHSLRTALEKLLVWTVERGATTHKLEAVSLRFQSRYLEKWRRYLMMRRKIADAFQLHRRETPQVETIDSAVQTVPAEAASELVVGTTVAVQTQLTQFVPSYTLAVYREMNRQMSIKYPISEAFLRQHKLKHLRNSIREVQTNNIQQQIHIARAKLWRIQRAWHEARLALRAGLASGAEMADQLQSTEHRLLRYSAILQSSEESTVHPRLISSMKQILYDMPEVYRAAWLSVSIQQLAWHRLLSRFQKKLARRRGFVALLRWKDQAMFITHQSNIASRFFAARSVRQALQAWQGIAKQHTNVRAFATRMALQRAIVRLATNCVARATDRQTLRAANDHVIRRFIRQWRRVAAIQRHYRTAVTVMQRQQCARLQVAAFQAWLQFRRAARMARALMRVFSRHEIRLWRELTTRRQSLAHSSEIVERHLEQQARIQHVEKLAERTNMREFWGAWRAALFIEHRRCIHADIARQIMVQQMYFNRWNGLCASRANLALQYRQAVYHRLRLHIHKWRHATSYQAEVTALVHFNWAQCMFKRWRRFLQGRQHARLDAEDSTGFHLARLRQRALFRWQAACIEKRRARTQQRVASMAHMRASAVAACGAWVHWAENCRRDRQVLQYTQAMHLSHIVNTWHQRVLYRRTLAAAEGAALLYGLRRPLRLWRRYSQRRRDLESKRATLERKECICRMQHIVQQWHQRFDQLRSLRAGLRLLRAVWQNERAQEDRLMRTAATYHRHKWFSKFAHRVFSRISVSNRINKTMQRHERRRVKEQLEAAIAALMRNSESGAISRRAKHIVFQAQQQKLRSLLHLWKKHYIQQQSVAGSLARAHNIRVLLAFRLWYMRWMKVSTRHNKLARALKHRKRVLLGAVFSAWWSCVAIS